MAGMPSATPQAVDLRVPSPKVGAAVEFLGTPDLAAAIEQAAAYALPYAGRLTSQFGGAEDWAAQKATVPPPPKITPQESAGQSPPSREGFPVPPSRGHSRGRPG